jgi:hypothetical protein
VRVQVYVSVDFASKKDRLLTLYSEDISICWKSNPGRPVSHLGDLLFEASRFVLVT